MEQTPEFLNGRVQTVFKDERTDAASLKMKIRRIPGFNSPSAKQLIANHWDATNKMEALKLHIDNLSKQVLEKMEAAGPRERHKLFFTIYDDSPLQEQAWETYIRDPKHDYTSTAETGEDIE